MTIGTGAASTAEAEIHWIQSERAHVLSTLCPEEVSSLQRSQEQAAPSPSQVYQGAGQ